MIVLYVDGLCEPINPGALWHVGLWPIGANVVVCSDSQLMVRQINGEYAAYSENIAGLYYQVHSQLVSFIRFVLGRFRGSKTQRLMHSAAGL